MKRVIYSDPNAQKYLITDKEIPKLYDDMISGFPSYWKSGICSAYLEFFNDDVLEDRLSINFHEEFGLCLTHEYMYDKLIKGKVRRQSIPHLAVYDKSKLNQVVDVYLELYTSVGLLLPAELAWKGISEFIKSGGKSIELEWITPDMLPEEGNWCC